MALAGQRREEKRRVVALPCCCDDEGRAACKFMSASEKIAKQRRILFPGKLSCIEEDFSGNIIWTLDIARGRDRGGGLGGDAMSRNYRRRQEEEGRGVVVVILILAVKNATCFYGLALGENLLFVKLR
jgi:hypothetical protein